MMMGLCFPHQHCQEFSKYCNKKVTAEEKDFFFYRQYCCAGSLQSDPRLLNITKLKKLQTKRRVQSDFMYLLGQVTVLGSDTQRITLGHYCEKERESVIPQDQYWFVCASTNRYTHPSTQYIYTHQIKYIRLHVLTHGVYLYIFIGVSPLWHRFPLLSYWKKKLWLLFPWNKFLPLQKEDMRLLRQKKLCPASCLLPHVVFNILDPTCWLAQNTHRARAFGTTAQVLS